MTGFEASDLGLLVRSYDDHAIHACMRLRFDQQSGIVDNDGMRRLGVDLLASALLLDCHIGMDDGIQPRKLLGVTKYCMAEAVPIQGAIGAEHVLAEDLDDLLQSRLARSHHLAGQRVSVHEVRPAFHEEARDRAFAGGDPACQPYLQHGRTLTHCIAATKPATIRAPCAVHCSMKP